MYQNKYSNAGTMSMCYYCMMANRKRNGIQPVMPRDNKYMFRGEEEFEEDRMDDVNTTSPMQQTNDMGNQMSNMMNMSKMDMEKIKADTQEIVMMLEQHHPDLIRTLTNCRMPIEQARQYLSRVVEMSLMHHMMHQM
ncbi:hypothetical protein [Clostridium sp.]|jgi:hypothetical protein|uniref:hypothetical protein n=1 Tax=Clostridium sp. TaxID=1506 RepID=UPI00258DEC6A|nr:hypothetical protein [Clostridium sp.]MDF2505964.1 hypothetical protein [Clostridium sp.]